MAFAKSQAQVDLVADVLSAIEDAPTKVRAVPLCVISRGADPETVLGVLVDGRRFRLSPEDVGLTAHILLNAQPFAGCNAIAHGMLGRLGQAELQTQRANVVRMFSPMGRG